MIKLRNFPVFARILSIIGNKTLNTHTHVLWKNSKLLLSISTDDGKSPAESSSRTIVIIEWHACFYNWYTI